MLIPQSTWKAFQIHLKSIMNNGIKGQSVETSVGNQTSTITCHSTKGPLFVVPHPQKKPNQLAGAATITALRVPRKYQEAEDLDNEVQGEDMSGDSFTDSFPADDDKVLEAAEAAARKRCSEAFSKGHRMYNRSEDEPATKRLSRQPLRRFHRNISDLARSTKCLQIGCISVKLQMLTAVELAR